jgi:hypothetical protein
MRWKDWLVAAPGPPQLQAVHLENLLLARKPAIDHTQEQRGHACTVTETNFTLFSGKGHTPHHSLHLQLFCLN